MTTCKEVGELSSQRLEIKPRFWHRLRVFLHCRRCPPCRTTARNFQALREAVRRARETVPSDCEGLADCSKKRMTAVIESTLLATKAKASTPAADGSEG